MFADDASSCIHRIYERNIKLSIQVAFKRTLKNTAKSTPIDVFRRNYTRLKITLRQPEKRYCINYIEISAR